ncbi:MAG: hypothetical protein ACR652_24360 [Methylocystis sp.]|uniref:hypothetical protein n=1 Tax=Methylocystis sp. TaxID=1911079 RepID=UPI003DA3E3AB
MTAPAVTAPAAEPTPTAQSQIRADDSAFMKQFGMESFLEKADDATEAPAPVEAARKPKAKPAEAPPAETPAEVPAETPPAEEVPVETPPAEAPAEVPAAEVKPKDYKAFDAAGEIEVPDLTLTFTANGKEQKKSLDQVIALAQRGFYNEEREAQVTQTRAEAQRIQQENAALSEHVQNIQRDITAMLSDPQDALYLDLKAKYAQANTPEAQLQRTRQQLETLQTSQQEAAMMAQVNAFAAPLQEYLSGLPKQYPTVSNEEIIGRFTVLTAPLLQAGRVPPSKFQQVAQLVDNELTPWVQHTHDSRSAAKAQQQATTQEQIKRETQVATSRAVIAKRQLTRALPNTAGTSPTPLRDTPKAPKYEKAGDILNDIGRLVQQAG